jgi:hypothetical protein
MYLAVWRTYLALLDLRKGELLEGANADDVTYVQDCLEWRGFEASATPRDDEGLQKTLSTLARTGYVLVPKVKDPVVQVSTWGGGDASRSRRAR